MRTICVLVLIRIRVTHDTWYKEPHTPGMMRPKIKSRETTLYILMEYFFSIM